MVQRVYNPRVRGHDAGDASSPCVKEHNMRRGRWWGVLVVLLVAVGGCATSNSQTAPTGTLNSQTAPTSTLDKLTTTRKIALGYRESSIPFSYVSPDKT